jgi:DNA-binding MarR family transcriptional regulator
MPRRPKSLQQHIRQTRPFRSTAQEGMLAILRSADELRRRGEGAVKGKGLTGQQYNVLRILRGAGAAGLPTLAITERMIERTPGITGLVDRLERKGLVRRQRGADDRRQVFCRITAAGLAVLAELDPVIDEVDESSLAMLDEPEQRTLVRLLEKVLNGLAE